MLKKTLLTAAAALVITTGVTTLSSSQAEAGYRFHIGGNWGHFHIGHYPKCYTKYKTVKVRYKVWSDYYCKYIWRTKWVKRPYKYCY